MVSIGIDSIFLHNSLCVPSSPCLNELNQLNFFCFIIHLLNTKTENVNLVPDQEAGGEQLAGDQGQHQRQEGVEQDGAVERLRIVFGVARALASDGENGSLERRRRGDVGKEESSVNVEHFNVVVNSGSVESLDDVQVLHVVAFENRSEGRFVQLLVFLSRQV